MRRLSLRTNGREERGKDRGGGDIEVLSPDGGAGEISYIGT